jgi:autotransporter-associated beta strand protein
MTLPGNVVLAGISEEATPKPAALSEFLVNQDLEISGQVSGTGGLLKTGGGQLTLSGVNTWTGPTHVQAGVLDCNGTAALGQGALTLDDKAKLHLDYKGTRRIAALTINGKALPSGTYGSADSPATTKDNTHFAGPGVVMVGTDKR